MNLCGLQVARCQFGPFIWDRSGRAQRGLRQRRAAIHTDVIRRVGARRTPGDAANKGRQIAHDRRRRDPVGTVCDL